MLRTGCDVLLDRPASLTGRRYGLLAHGASVTADLVPLHVALASSAAGAPARLFGPEHGYYGVEQDMVASADERDPWTGAPIASLYGEDSSSLRPRADAFDGLTVLVIDLQDVGSRYYTYAATAVWAAEVALAAGVEVLVLDRPNPLGGVTIEGNLPKEGLESFVGAFAIPVRHGLTLGELVWMEALRRGWDAAGLRVVTMPRWRRKMVWAQTRRPWIAPSPNMPAATTAEIYPGACLIEATLLSEGRGTTRPFHLIGAPGVDPTSLVAALEAFEEPGIRFVPTYFRPQFQKHAGARCGGVEVVVTNPRALRSYETFLRLMGATAALAPDVFGWRREPYEFVSEIPAMDLLTGDDVARRAIDDGGRGLEGWIAGFAADEAAFREARRPALLYPESA